MASPTRDFMCALFGGVADDQWTLIWQLATKRSTWVRLGEGGSDRLAETALRLGADGDVYISVSTADGASGQRSRITRQQSSGIVGLWADIDIADPDVHSKWNLPPDVESALRVVGAAGLAPSIVLHSGHGIQVWWLLMEHHRFDGERGRVEAASMAEAWNQTLRLRAAENNWTVDSVFDLARVMRIPGTTNFKKADLPVEVALLSCHPERRYSFDDFRPHLLTDEHARMLGISGTRTYVVGDLRLDPDASPPFAKFQTLYTNDHRFAATWDGKRRDLPSASEYDLALASMASLAGWADQEIVDLLIAWRVRQGEPQKLRQDYYRRTVAKARSNQGKAEAASAADQIVETLETARSAGDDELIREHRRELLQVISTLLDYQVSSVVKYLSDPPSFALVTPGERILFRSSNEMLNWGTFRAAFWAATGHNVPKMKGEWENFITLLGQAVEEHAIGIEATEGGLIASWLHEYLMNRPPTPDASDALLHDMPFVAPEGRVHVFGSGLRTWVAMTLGERVSTRDLGRMLREHGATNHTMPVTKQNGKRTTRSVWRLPEDYDQEVEA